jgi:hypothetical protein
LLSNIKKFVLHILSNSLPEAQQIQPESSYLRGLAKRKATEAPELEVLTRFEKKLFINEPRQITV